MILRAPLDGDEAVGWFIYGLVVPAVGIKGFSVEGIQK